MSFEEFQDGQHDGHLGYQNRTILAILNLYNAPMPPIKFRLSLTWFGRRCRLKNFKIAAVGYRNGTILAILNLYVTVMLPIKFWLNQTVWEEISFEEFQDGDHLGYRIGTNLAILNLYISLMPPIRFWFNLTYGLGGDVIWRISRWLPW